MNSGYEVDVSIVHPLELVQSEVKKIVTPQKGKAACNGSVTIWSQLFRSEVPPYQTPMNKGVHWETQATIQKQEKKVEQS